MHLPESTVYRQEDEPQYEAQGDRHHNQLQVEQEGAAKALAVEELRSFTEKLQREGSCQLTTFQLWDTKTILPRTTARVIYS